MKLQEQMFGLITDWYESKLIKKDFLEGKNISNAKFDYWIQKYHSKFKEEKTRAPSASKKDFTQISLPQFPNEIELTKILELKTARGLMITIFEKC